MNNDKSSLKIIRVVTSSLLYHVLQNFFRNHLTTGMSLQYSQNFSSEQLGAIPLAIGAKLN